MGYKFSQVLLAPINVDTTPGGGASAYLLEDGVFGILLESGDYLLLEG